MKRLLFSHKSDVDGMGEVILSLIAFGSIDYILCKNVKELEEVFLEAYNNKALEKYDIIYITDLSLTRETIEMIMNDASIRNKLYLFDHHETALKNGLNDFSNCVVRIENDIGKSCATQIFYEYLLENKYISSNAIIDDFVEMVRREDTYEWKKLNDIKSHELAILFNQIGCTQFINQMQKKLVEGSQLNKSTFEFDNIERELIQQKKEDINERVIDFIKNISIKEIKLSDTEAAKVGVCFIVYEYRNEVADFIRYNSSANYNEINPDIFDIDVVAMVAVENNQISLRSTKDNDFARKIAEMYGGGGHDQAAAIPIKNELFERLVNDIFDK